MREPVSSCSPLLFPRKGKALVSHTSCRLQPLKTFLGTIRPPCMLAKTWLDILIPRIRLVYHLTAGFILKVMLCNFQLLKQEQHTGTLTCVWAHAHTHYTYARMHTQHAHAQQECSLILGTGSSRCSTPGQERQRGFHWFVKGVSTSLEWPQDPRHSGSGPQQAGLSSLPQHNFPRSLAPASSARCWSQAGGSDSSSFCCCHRD